MKKAFTQFTSVTKTLSRTGGVTEAEVYDLYIKNSQQAFWNQKPEDRGSFLECQMIVANECAIIFAKHIFLSDENFITWLIDACPQEDKSDWFGAFENQNHHQPMIFHFPTQSGFDSFFFNCATDPEKNQKFGFISCGDGAFYIYDQKKFNLGNAINAEKFLIFAKIAISVLLYCECFPECVIDGVPEFVKHPSHHKYTDSCSLDLSPKIYTKKHGSPCGHFRSGHFRLLKSDRYKEKRFKFVFVSQTFVKGKAVTVLSPDQS
jgi:hypothetical protein